MTSIYNKIERLFQVSPRFSSCWSDIVSNASILITVWSFQLFFLRLCLLPSTLQVPSSAQNIHQLKALDEYELKQCIWFLLNRLFVLAHFIYVFVYKYASMHVFLNLWKPVFRCFTGDAFWLLLFCSGTVCRRNSPLNSLAHHCGHLTFYSHYSFWFFFAWNTRLHMSCSSLIGRC